MLLDFPTVQEWDEIAKGYPSGKMEFSMDAFKYVGDPSDMIEYFFAAFDIPSLVLHLKNRLAQVKWSYVMSIFYFDKGIPDEEWFCSPAKTGESIEYFPNFSEDDWKPKSLFDYFSDAFYHKLFSAWDTLGHLLNTIYGLKLKKPSFNSAVQKLQQVHPILATAINRIMENPDFQLMRKLRHDITHNYLPGHPGSNVTRKSEKELTFGVGTYITSKVIKDNMDKSLDLFAATLEAIRMHNHSDTSKSR